MRVSVVLNTCNRANSLRRTIQSLRHQRFRDFEVIVVNGPSTDHTEDVIRALGKSVKSANIQQLSLGISRNVGIDLAAGEIVAFVDDDAVAEPDWLERLV